MINFFLISWAVLHRLLPIWGNHFAFMFDHAKDSLVIMEMGTRFKPALFGAVTSIPGLFNGPLWYYLALPLNMLMNYHPFASVLTIIILSAISTYLAYKWFGKFAGLIYAGSIGLVGAQQSAWTPYMTVFPMLALVYFLLKLKSGGKLSKKAAIAIPLLVSSLFHFQTAFGVVIMPLVIACLFWLKIKIPWKQALMMILLFALPFLPLVIFDLRHDFHQTKQIVNFVQHYGEAAAMVQGDSFGLNRVVAVAGYWLQSAGQAISPLVNLSTSLGLVLVIATGWLLFRSTKTTRVERVILGVLLLGPLLLYQFLPSKSYYFVGLQPIWLVVVVLLVKQFPSLVQKTLFFGWLLLSAGGLVANTLRTQVTNETYFLSSKLAAVEKVYELSQGRPFVSYQYVPEIYDYPYQLIYLTKIRAGDLAPVEFSYAPGEISYIPQKHVQTLDQEPEVIYLIVEDYLSKDNYKAWQQRVGGQLKIISQHQISPGITVYEAVK